jgi:hypothetical protein
MKSVLWCVLGAWWDRCAAQRAPGGLQPATAGARQSAAAEGCSRAVHRHLERRRVEGGRLLQRRQHLRQPVPRLGQQQLDENLRVSLLLLHALRSPAIRRSGRRLHQAHVVDTCPMHQTPTAGQARARRTVIERHALRMPAIVLAATMPCPKYSWSRAAAEERLLSACLVSGRGAPGQAGRMQRTAPGCPNAHLQRLPQRQQGHDVAGVLLCWAGAVLVAQNEQGICVAGLAAPQVLRSGSRAEAPVRLQFGQAGMLAGRPPSQGPRFSAATCWPPPWSPWGCPGCTCSSAR